MEFTASTMLAVVVAVQRGDLSAAVAHGETALELWPQIDRTPALERWFSTSIRCFVEALLRRGDIGRARDIASALASDGDTSGTMYGLIAVAGALVAQAEADDARALEALMAYGGVFRAVGIEDRTTPWRLYAALSLHRLNRSQEAVELADEAVEVAETWATPGGLGMARRVRAVVGDPAEATDRLERAVDTLRRSAYRLELAEALVDLGRAERRAGRPKSSRAPLTEGLDMAIACGAAPLADRARSELRVAGARRRRDRIAGRDALTPTEQRIAGLAAGGDTNREIAQALFVTPKTVELHLTNVYRKLDITGRAQLAQALENATL
jgi:DNA-binding CsgD family transcriptional regulator